MEPKQITLVVLQRINIVRPVANSLVGKHHTFRHRALTGIIVMLVGVLIAKTVGHTDSLVVAMIADGIGYALHGLGLTPFIEALLERAEEA